MEKNNGESNLSKTNEIGDLEDLNYETEKLTNSVKEEMVNVISTEGEGDKNPKERTNYIKNGLKKKTFYTSRQGRHKSNVYKSAYSVVDDKREAEYARQMQSIWGENYSLPSEQASLYHKYTLNLNLRKF